MESFKLKKICFLFISLLISANTYSQSLTWHEGKVNWVYPQANGDFIITFKNDSALCTNTGNPKYHYVRKGMVSVTQDGVNAMLSTALAAGLSDKAIKVSFDKDSTACDIHKLYITM